jgi:ankyrin repeat/BTB/POZ domain-containing protein 1
LTEKEEVHLNIRDKWDSTPLYYACLCGHLALVEYLLSNGAKCEANTFDGERCQYGALTDQIRAVLRNFKVAQNTKLDQYEMFMQRLFEFGQYADLMFEIRGRLFKTHKCILAARSEYFRAKLENKWRKRKWIVGTHEEVIVKLTSIFKELICNLIISS